MSATPEPGATIERQLFLKGFNGLYEASSRTQATLESTTILLIPVANAL